MHFKTCAVAVSVGLGLVFALAAKSSLERSDAATQSVSKQIESRSPIGSELARERKQLARQVARNAAKIEP
jgi:hypothetical protein